MNGRLKILVVVPSLRRGGAERTVARLTQEWSKSHDVQVAVFNARDRAYVPGGTVLDLGLPSSGGFRVRGRMFAPLFTGFARVARLRELIRSRRPDRIFAFMETANIPVVLAAILEKQTNNVTISIRGNPDRMRWFHRLLARILYPRSSAIVVVSQGAATRLNAIIPASAPRTHVIYSPLDLAEIDSLSAKDPSSGSLGTLPDGPFFFSAGRLDDGKDFDRMIRLFESARLPGMRLLIAGEGPARSRLERRILDAGLVARVVLLGAVENPFAYMKRATAFLLTSRHEGFPVVLIEAFACACPVVAFDCDFGPREANPDGRAGFIVPLEDDAQFVTRLESLAEDPELRATLSRAALVRARDFEVAQVAARWLETLRMKSGPA